jgi:hypothetical protein
MLSTSVKFPAKRVCGSSSDGILYRKCVVCSCVLNDDNRSEILNLCYECWRGLTR